MGKSSGTWKAGVGRLRGKLDSRRERRAEKARVKSDAKREWERSRKGPGHVAGGGPGIGAM